MQYSDSINCFLNISAVDIFQKWFSIQNEPKDIRRHWPFFVHTLPNTHYLKLFYELIRLWQRKEMGENRGKWKIMKEMSLPVYCLTATNCNAAGRTNWQNFTEDDTDVREYEVISTWRVHSNMYITSTWFQLSTSCQHSIRLEFSSGLPLSPLGQNPMLLGIQEHSQPPPDQHKLHSLLLNPIPKS